MLNSNNACVLQNIKIVVQAVNSSASANENISLVCIRFIEQQTGVLTSTFRPMTGAMQATIFACSTVEVIIGQYYSARVTKAHIMGLF